MNVDKDIIFLFAGAILSTLLSLLIQKMANDFWLTLLFFFLCGSLLGNIILYRKCYKPEPPNQKTPIVTSPEWGDPLTRVIRLYDKPVIEKIDSDNSSAVRLELQAKNSFIVEVYRDKPEKGIFPIVTSNPTTKWSEEISTINQKMMAC